MDKKNAKKILKKNTKGTNNILKDHQHLNQDQSINKNKNINMISLIKEKLCSENILDEESAMISNVKPFEAPKKPNKNEFEMFEKSEVIGVNGVSGVSGVSGALNINTETRSGMNEGKENRLKAYNIMKKKQFTIEEINQLSKMNNEPLDKNIYQGNYYKDEDKHIDKINITNKSNLSMLNQFEQYYNNKFEVPNEDNEKTNFRENLKINKNTYEVKLCYCFGMNTHSDSDSICFHKKDKWVCYLNQNLIIIENFREESNRNQRILNDSKFGLDVIKISENGKIVMAYSTNMNNANKHPQILFYIYNPEYEQIFKLINITIIKHNRLSDCEISPQNNLCSNMKEETFISLLDYSNNEILMTTVLNIDYLVIKWNPFLTNLEFSTLSDKLYTFWRINSSDVSLQYQHGDFNNDLIDTKGVSFTSMCYTPPLSVNLVILLLIGLSNGEIWGIDTKTNSINIKYSLLVSPQIKGITCSIKYISLKVDNSVKYYKLPFLKEIQHTDLNLFVNKEEELKFDSEVIALDLDLMTTEGLALTKKGNLYCINYQENRAIRLFSVLDEKSEIIQTKMITRDHQFYSLRKIDYENLELEQIASEVRENYYYLITAHKGGVIKVWSIPEYEIHLNLEVVTEEILCFDSTPNDLKIAVSYSSGLLRFFDISKESFIGKYKSISGQPYKFLKFLPDGEFLFAVDTNNTVFLIKIEKFEPLLIQIHQLFNVSGDIIDFKLNLVEHYNKFMVNIQNVYLHVYNRKFTNILKNISYDNSIPVFYVQDKFNTDEYLRSINTQENLNLDVKNGEKLIENFHYEFSPNLAEKSLVYILSEGRKLLLIRNFEMHTIIKSIKYNQTPLNFLISDNSAFMAVLFNDKFQLSQMGQDNDVGVKFNIPGLSKKVKSFEISPNGKIIIIYTMTSIFFYNIAYI